MWWLSYGLFLYCLSVLMCVMSLVCRDSVVHNYMKWRNPSLFLSTPLEVTTTGAAHCLPIPRPCGPAVPAGITWEVAVPAPPHLLLRVQPSPPPLQGPSTDMAWQVLAELLEEAYVSEVLVLLHLRAATSNTSNQMRRSRSSLLLLHNLFTLHVLYSRATLHPEGIAELYHLSCPTCCRHQDPRNIYCHHTTCCPPFHFMFTKERASQEGW